MGATDIFTLEDIATEVGQTYGSTDATSLAKIKKWVNRSLIDISNFGEWPFLKDGDLTIDTVASQSEYDFDPTIKEIRKLFWRDNNDYKLTFVPFDKWINSIVDDTDASGTPTHYTIVGWNGFCQGWKVRLWPQPDAVETLYISADLQLPLFEADEDDMRGIMPENMLPVLIALAEKYALKDLNEISENDRIAESRIILSEAHAKMNQQRDARHRQKPHEVPDVNRALDPILPPNFS